MSSESLI